MGRTRHIISQISLRPRPAAAHSLSFPIWQCFQNGQQAGRMAGRWTSAWQPQPLPTFVSPLNLLPIASACFPFRSFLPPFVFVLSSSRAAAHIIIKECVITHSSSSSSSSTPKRVRSLSLLAFQPPCSPATRRTPSSLSLPASLHPSSPTTLLD